MIELEIHHLATMTIISESSKKTFVDSKTGEWEHIYSLRIYPHNILIKYERGKGSFTVVNLVDTTLIK